MEDRKRAPGLLEIGRDLHRAARIPRGDRLGTRREQVLRLPPPELGRRKARNLLDTGAEIVAAANPGCAIQIAAHSERLGHRMPVLHPMELLATSINGGGP